MAFLRLEIVHVLERQHNMLGGYIYNPLSLTILVFHLLLPIDSFVTAPMCPQM